MRGRSVRRRRLSESVAARAALLAFAAAAAPLAAAVTAGAHPALLALAAAVAGLAVAGIVWLLRPLAQLADALDHYGDHRAAGRGAQDDFSRIRRGLKGLEARLEAATRRADPARLEDPLTGLPNRLAVMRRTRDEIARARRKATPMAVALLALDGFPAAEKALGRLETERVLRLTAETLVQALRAYDLVGRWEGATFVAVLPEAEVENAVDAMRRVRERIADDRIGTVAGAPIGASAGVAVLQPDDATLADIAARAARALALAQARGRGVEAAPGPRTRPPRITSV